MFTRKLLCLLLALVLVAGLVTTAHAAPPVDLDDASAALLGALRNKDITLDDSRLTLAEVLGQATDEIAKRAYVAALLQEYDAIEIECEDRVNVWQDTDKETSLLTLRSGKVAHLEDIQDDWYLVTFGDVTGYVDSQYAHLAHYADYEDTSAVTTEREDLVALAQEWLGTRYRYGGSSKSGTDCSGFTMAVFKEFGYNLYHGASDQYRSATPITTEERDMGDLVFFSFYGDGRIAHVGIYIGNGLFIHASTSRGVIISSVYESYYAKNYIGAARVLPE